MDRRTESGSGRWPGLDDRTLDEALEIFRRRGLRLGLRHGDARIAAAKAVLKEFASLPGAWECDRCGQSIEQAVDGRLEWIWAKANRRAFGLQLVHTRSASPPSIKRKADLRLVSETSPEGDQSAHSSCCGYETAPVGGEILSIPLQHLTDADGLMQLLELIADSQLDPMIVLEVIQRIHIPRYEAARRHVENAVSKGIIKPNRLSGFHWQGDLAEVLRFAKPGPETGAAVGSGSGPRVATAPSDQGPSRGSEMFAQDTDLSEIIASIKQAGLSIEQALRRGRHLGPQEQTYGTNIHGEPIKGIDVVAHQAFESALGRCRAIGAILSEEVDEPILLDRGREARFVVALDPLDGSDNVAPGLSVGSIFSVRRMRSRAAGPKDFLGASDTQVAAGYLLYGHALQFVVTDGLRLEWHVYDHEKAAFILREAELRSKEPCSILSVNHCYEPFWPTWMKRYFELLKERASNGKPTVVSRFVGTLVAEIHRNILAGGVVIVPADRRRPSGKLRLVYECSPIAMILKASGGTATDGAVDTLALEAHDPHERCGFVAGCESEVEAIRRLVSAGQRGTR